MEPFHDAIILAAGSNERLKGIVPSYYKPLILVDGEPLIKRIVRQVKHWRPGRIVVVASPYNIQAIVDVLEDGGSSDLQYVIQPTPTGPINAVYRGVLACSAPAVNIICGDNIISHDDFEGLHRKFQKLMADQNDMLLETALAWGFTNLYEEAATRFTVYDEDTKAFIDKPPSPELYAVERKVPAWIGPILIQGPTNLWDGSRKTFAEVFNEIPPKNRTTFMSHAVDIGVPSALNDLPTSKDLL